LRYVGCLPGGDRRSGTGLKDFPDLAGPVVQGDVHIFGTSQFACLLIDQLQDLFFFHTFVFGGYRTMVVGLLPRLSQTAP